MGVGAASIWLAPGQAVASGDKVSLAGGGGAGQGEGILMEQLQGLKGWEYLLSQARAPTLPRAQLSRKPGGGGHESPYLLTWLLFP